MKRSFFILAFVLTALCLTGRADTLSTVDSLLNIYSSTKGTQRTGAARQLMDIYGENAVFFNDAPTIADGMTSAEQDLTVWFGTARFYTTCAHYKEALDYIDRAQALNSEPGLNTSEYSSLFETLLCDKAYCLFKTSDYERALEAGQEAMRRSQESEDWMQLSRAYLYISLVNHSLRKYDEAKALVVKAIETNERLGLNVQTHNALGIACEIFCSAMEVDKAVDYGRQAVEAARQIGYMPGVANHLTQLAYAYDRKGDYALGLQMADSAIAMVRATDPLDRNQLALALEYKSWNLIDIGRQREAADALHQAIALQTELGNTHAVWYDYRTLSEALEAFDPHGSIEALKRYTRMGDSIHSEQLKELMSQANAEFHNDELQEENAESQRMNRIITWTAIIVVLLLAAVIASLLFAFRQKKRAAAALQRLTEARETFFTNITHEFRTPLTIILGLSQELQKSVAPETSASPETAQIGQTIERQGRQLLALVNQLLDISKVKSALVEQPQTQGDLSAYVAMVVERHQELARQKGVTLTYYTNMQGQEETFVADYVEKMVSNLLSNAIKFTPEGGKVTLQLTPTETGGVSLVVSDTGIGIDPEHLPHVFEPFYQADDTAGTGTGVGLALVKQIVDAMGGTITAESRKGEGTTFRVEMNQQAQTHPRSLPAGREVVTTLPSLLIVEDNADVAALIGRQLEGRYTLHYATDGEQGIQKASQLMPDLIITDLMMPGTDGLQLCDTIRHDADTDHIPIIVITAKATEQDRLKGLAAGADAYLYKPFNAEELNLRITKLLGMRNLLRKKFATAPLPAAPEAPAVSAAPEAPVAPVVSEAPDAPEQSPTPPFSTSSQAFITKVDTAILDLMASRQADVEHVAAYLCISPYQLRSKLTAIAGVPPMKYILNFRLQQARRMLTENPKRTITDVGESCGFYDGSHFVRHFRNAFGVTPGDFVKNPKN